MRSFRTDNDPSKKSKIKNQFEEKKKSKKNQISCQKEESPQTRNVKMLKQEGKGFKCN
jgi:hypothetical protein